MSDTLAPTRRSWLLALPLLFFLALAGIFLARLQGGDPSRIPSALIGRPALQLERRLAHQLLKYLGCSPGLERPQC